MNEVLGDFHLCVVGRSASRSHVEASAYSNRVIVAYAMNRDKDAEASGRRVRNVDLRVRSMQGIHSLWDHPVWLACSTMESSAVKCGAGQGRALYPHSSFLVFFYSRSRPAVPVPAARPSAALPACSRCEKRYDAMRESTQPPGLRHQLLASEAEKEGLRRLLAQDVRVGMVLFRYRKHGECLVCCNGSIVALLRMSSV